MSCNIWHEGVCDHVMLSKLPDGEGRGSTIFLPSLCHLHIEVTVLEGKSEDGGHVSDVMLFFMSVSFPFLPEKN